MLEQEAQMFGLRERALPITGIGSPQHMQTRGLIPLLPFLLAHLPNYSHRHGADANGSFQHFLALRAGAIFRLPAAALRR
jgi:hypothetical protein